MRADLAIEAAPHGGRADALLETFARVVATMPWYRTLLADAGVDPRWVRDDESFARWCPLLDKRNTFERFTLPELAATTAIPDLAGVLTSSGHGGRFSFGLTSRSHDEAGGDAIDAALDAAFAVRSRPTLALNCLPMGVTFRSRCMTVATTSVREDMAVALIQTFGASYAQLLLVADPLFLKRLTDHARACGLDWRRHRVQVVVGEEVFGEHFRAYMADRLGLGAGQHPDTYLMSSFGVGELGLHLLYETRSTAAVRRRLTADPRLAAALVGGSASTCGVPVLFTYDDRRLHLEIDAPDAEGFGALTISMLDPTLPIPLLRYQTGDVARLLDVAAIDAALARSGCDLPEALPSRVVAVRGRRREALPNGATVALYKDALYATPHVADRLTGAVRLTFAAGQATLHVQLVDDCEDDHGIADALMAAVPVAARPSRVHLWPYRSFPFGMTLDYERKFVGYRAP